MAKLPRLRYAMIKHAAGEGAMVTMSGIWDDTVEVLRGRSAILTRIALPALFFPALVRDGWTAFAGPTSGAAPSVTASAMGGLLAVVAALVSVWGQLAVVAVASNPATTQADASALATRRFGPALGVYAVLLLAGLALLIPIVIGLASAGLDWAALARGQTPAVAPRAGPIGFVFVYGLAITVVALVAAARLFLINPVIVNERAGLRAFGRSWLLTKGLAWRIIGVTILFAIVWGIAASAAQFVLGTLFRLALGADSVRAVQFLVAVVSAVLTTIYMVVVTSFSARLYAARTHLGVAEVFA